MPAPVPPNPPPRPPVDPASLGTPRMPTRLESADEIRAAIQARQAEQAVDNPAPPLVGPLTKTSPMLPPMPDILPAATAAPAVAARPSARLFRPTQRPPVPLLCVFDDGADDGEVFRV